MSQVETNMFKLELIPSTALTPDRVMMTVQQPRCFSIEYLNGIKRTLSSDVPSLAVERVSQMDNYHSDDLPIEKLCHALAFVPIQSFPPDELASLPFQSECFCQVHCNKCSIYLSLKACNIRTDGQSTRVTSKDIKMDHSSSNQKGGFGSALLGLNETFIMNLSPGESINFTLIVQKGTGKGHAKWMPVTAVAILDREEEDDGLDVRGSGIMPTRNAISDAMRIMAESFRRLGDEANLVTVGDYHC